MVKVIVDREKLILGAPAPENYFSRVVELALDNITGVELDRSLARDWLRKLEFLAEFIPSAKRAGAFYEDGNCIFWEVRDPKLAIVISLENEAWEKFIIEVEDPNQSLETIRSALRNKKEDSKTRDDLSESDLDELEKSEPDLF